MVAERRRDRARGLLGTTGLAPGEALLIPEARSVHTVGMRFPILVVRLDGSLRVVDVRRVRSGRLVMPRRRARHVLEAPVELDLKVGDVLRPAQAGQEPMPAVPVTTQEPA
jgi:hypothetical protein